MKPRKISNKSLRLGKSTIVHLQNEEISKIRGRGTQITQCRPNTECGPCGPPTDTCETVCGSCVCLTDCCG